MKRGASHGSYRHRRPQAGTPDRHPGGGGELSEPRLRPAPERFAEVLGDRPRARSLREASTESEGGARGREGWGPEVIVADPTFAPLDAARSRKIKPDRRDARALAEACRGGADRPAHRLSDAQRHGRGRLTVRDARVRTRTGYVSVVRALLRQHGWRGPTGSAAGFIRRVLALPRPGRRRSEVAPRLAVMRQVNQPLADSDERIAAGARADERVARLQTGPSVGPVTAAAFVATRDDAGRFAHAPQVEVLPGPGAPRVERGRGPAPRADHHGGPTARALAAGPGRRVHPARAAFQHDRPPGVGRAPRRAAGPVHRRRRVDAAPGRDPRCAAPRRHPGPPRPGPTHAEHGRRAGVARSAPHDHEPRDSPGSTGGGARSTSGAAARGPQRRWRPRSSTPYMRRRASLATTSANRRMMTLARPGTTIRTRGTAGTRKGTRQGQPLHRRKC